MKHVSEMTDAEIVASVRSGDCALVPISADSDAIVGRLTLDDFEGVEGETALLVRLGRDEARFVAPQVIDMSAR